MLPETGLSRSISLTIEGNSYEVKFPTIREINRIESLKMMHSVNMYGAMVRNATVASQRSLDYIDMISHYTVLVPSLTEDLKGVDSIEDLDPIQGKVFLSAYKKHLKPWLDKWMEIVNAPDEDLGKEEPEEESPTVIEESSH